MGRRVSQNGGSTSNLSMVTPWVTEETYCYRTKFMFAGQHEPLKKDCIRVGITGDIIERHKLERKLVCAGVNDF